jgi:primosomal protein N' (replication factor Y)
VALLPREWARAAAGGCVVVGARAAAWAPVPRLAAAVVIDEHDEVYQEERAPTWNARDVVVERARRAGAPCWLTSPCPSLAALSMDGAGGEVTVRLPSREDERSGWPVIEVVDRREEAPGLGLYSERLVALLREATPDCRVVCVLNRKGRAVLIACVACREVARCETCDGPMESGGELGMRCKRCGAEQPPVCRWCSSGKFKALRIGVARVREELELLAGQPVAEITADTPAGAPPPAPVLVGTEAVLHRASRAGVVAFLDFDQELLAPRYRAGEEALALMARAGAVVGGREGRVLVQTRVPGHEVLDAALHADPSRLAVVEFARRAALRLPPETALARVSGAGAAPFVDGLRDVEVLGPAGDRWLVRAPDHGALCDALAAAPKVSERVRVEVDPLRA